MAPILAGVPFTQVEPVTEVLHGVEITDPYRWLEDQHSLPTRRWLEEQTAYARSYLDAIPNRDHIRKRIEEFLAVEVISEPCKVKERYFFLKRAAHQEQPVIAMREGRSGEDNPLIDPAERGEGATAAVSLLSVSNDGQLLAYRIRHGGDDAYAVEFFDVERRQVLPDRLPHGFCHGLVFSPSGDGFYYSHMSSHVARPHYRSVCWHTFGMTAIHDREVFFAGEDPQLRLYVLASPDLQYLVYQVIRLDDPPSTDLYIHHLSHNHLPCCMATQLTNDFRFFVVGSQLITVTDWRAPNYRVLAIDLDQPGQDNWRQIIPECDQMIHDVAIVDGLIFICYVENTITRIEIFDLSGQRQGFVSCPSNGTTRFLSWLPGGDTLFYEFTSFSHPSTTLTYHAPSGKSEVWGCTQVPFDSSSIDVRQVMYPSKDGTQIPMFLLGRKEYQGSRPRPTFLTGYGGFGRSVRPEFAVYAAFLMEQGFLFGAANLRGGAEFGRRWHEAARRRKRQNAIDDFVAAAEWLISQGYTTADKLAIGGGSNGGLLVGAALTQRPDLFRAVLCLGPMLDMLRFHKFDRADEWVEELGSPEIAEDFPFLKAYSPYHRVKKGISYPAVMLISGDADTRCNPLHARKMTAQLQAATVSSRPILLDYKFLWGHMPTQSLTTRIDALTDRLAFLCQELGVIV